MEADRVIHQGVGRTPTMECHYMIFQIFSQFTIEFGNIKRKFPLHKWPMQGMFLWERWPIEIDLEDLSS